MKEKYRRVSLSGAPDNYQTIAQWAKNITKYEYKYWAKYLNYIQSTFSKINDRYKYLNSEKSIWLLLQILSQKVIEYIIIKFSNFSTS